MATLLVGDMIAQNFLRSQLIPELGHVAPSVNIHLTDLGPMNPIPAPLDNGAIEEKPRLHGHTISGRGEKLWPPL
jgi:hypothetical protein